METFKLVGTGACSSQMLMGFWEKNPAKLEALYRDAMEHRVNTTFALVSKRDEKPAYEFLLKKGWVDVGYYTGNSNGEMHLMTLGMTPIAGENPVKKAIRTKVRAPLTRGRRRVQRALGI